MTSIKLLKSGIVITTIGIIVSFFGLISFYYAYLPSVALEITGLSIIAYALNIEYRTIIEKKEAWKINILLWTSIIFYCIYFTVQLFQFLDFVMPLISLISQTMFGFFLFLAGFFIRRTTINHHGFELFFFGLINFLIPPLNLFADYSYRRFPSNNYSIILVFVFSLLFFIKLALVARMVISIDSYFYFETDFSQIT